MSFEKKDNIINKWVTINRDLASCVGTLKKGSRAQITEETDRGYSVRDSEGHEFIECGYCFFDKETVSEYE